MKKSFFFVLFVLFFLFCLANVSEAIFPCSTVDLKVVACVGFATGKYPTPSHACCNGLQRLLQTVKSVDDKRGICKCLKFRSKNLGIRDELMSKIPQYCNINVGFPVASNTDCDTIN